MINVKDQVYAALCTVAENVSDLYPSQWTAWPAIQYTEEANNVALVTDGKEQLADLRYRIDIWDNKSTSETALAVDEALAKIGLFRSECADVPDPSGFRHKQMRYTATIDVNNQSVYWEQAQ